MKVEDRLDAVERELAEIRATLSVPHSPRIVKLKGIWKGLRASESDIAEAKRSLFKNAVE